MVPSASAIRSSWLIGIHLSEKIKRPTCKHARIDVRHRNARSTEDTVAQGAQAAGNIPRVSGRREGGDGVPITALPGLRFGHPSGPCKGRSVRVRDTGKRARVPMPLTGPHGCLLMEVLWGDHS